MLFYDIPNNNSSESKNYSKFRKYIIANGFIMLQESVYVKSVASKETHQILMRNLKLASPTNSNIRTLLVTENVFEKMQIIAGEESINEQVLSKKTRIIEL